jgi:hypothetical protein
MRILLSVDVAADSVTPYVTIVPERLDYQGEMPGSLRNLEEGRRTADVLNKVLGFADGIRQERAS